MNPHHSASPEWITPLPEPLTPRKRKQCSTLLVTKFMVLGTDCPLKPSHSVAADWMAHSPHGQRETRSPCKWLVTQYGVAKDWIQRTLGRHACHNPHHGVQFLWSHQHAQADSGRCREWHNCIIVSFREGSVGLNSCANTSYSVEHPTPKNSFISDELPAI